MIFLYMTRLYAVFLCKSNVTEKKLKTDFPDNFQSIYTISKMFKGNRQENIVGEYATFNKNYTPKDIFIHSK